MKRIALIVLLTIFIKTIGMASYIFIPMNEDQKNHLKAYGIAYWVLDHKTEVFWLLNYEGGSFAFKNNPIFEKECKTRNVSYSILPDAKYANIVRKIADPEVNMDVIKLEVPPRMAVYSPAFNSKGEKIQPWDDAVTMVLEYAEIPYDVIYDKEVLSEKLAMYDWLHLHHEDFTGQFGKFYKSYHTKKWYKDNEAQKNQLAKELGFNKVSELKLAVVKKIREFVGGGGFMFAMCSATDTYDIALAADGVDICASIYDGDPVDPGAQGKLNFENTFAFKDFRLTRNPTEYEYSSIDHSKNRKVLPKSDYFNLFDFSAKWDPVPSMLTQNHTQIIKGFMGQTTAYKYEVIKSGVLILGENKPAREARYIHGEQGKGTWTFYGGHDPEDYRHYVNDPETDLDLHPNSPGYRLILNNVLFPAAKKKKRKT